MPGATLDIEDASALIAWLQSTGRIEPFEVPRIQILHGGVSNRTVRVQRTNGECWVLKQALERLRVPTEWRSSPARVHREALGMRWLARLVPAGSVPEFLFEEESVHVIAMQAVPEPHTNWKTLLLAGVVEDWAVVEFARLLACIHSRSVAEVWRPNLQNAFRDRSFFEGLRLEPFYQFTSAQVPAAAAFLEPLIAESRRIQTALVHGDYSPKNILVRHRQLILLDHEVIHWGDPMFDVGFAMAHFLCKAARGSGHRDAFLGAVERFWSEYQACVDPSLADEASRQRALRHALGCALARVAGRSQVEYLTNRQKEIQRRWICRQSMNPPVDGSDLIKSFPMDQPETSAVDALDPNDGPGHGPAHRDRIG